MLPFLKEWSAFIYTEENGNKTNLKISGSTAIDNKLKIWGQKSGSVLHLQKNFLPKFSCAHSFPALCFISKRVLCCSHLNKISFCLEFTAAAHAKMNSTALAQKIQSPEYTRQGTVMGIYFPALQCYGNFALTALNRLIAKDMHSTNGSKTCYYPPSSGAIKHFSA